MPQYLCISTHFLTGRYHGKEWPPSPARLMKALIAGVMTGGYRRHWANAESVLRWLENQPPPQIIASQASYSSPYRLSVPNNDSDAAARSQKRPETFRTLKTVRPRNIWSPRVYYLWRLPEAQEPDTTAVATLVRCLHTLGWGIDMAFAEAMVLDEEAKLRLSGDLYVPTPRNNTLRLEIPVEGFVKNVLETYSQFCRRHSKTGVNPDVRPTIYGIQSYRRADKPPVPQARFLLQRLGDSSPYAVMWHRTMVVASWLRHAAAEALQQEGYRTGDINRFVLGHPADSDSRGSHMSFVPLPSIGHAHSDGQIRRVLLAEAPDSSGELTAILQTKLSGHVLTDENGRRVCILAEPDDAGRVWPFYYGPSPVWRSVTPVVLHGHNASRGKLSLSKTEKLIREAFEKGGHPAASIEVVFFQPAPLWAGAESALAIRVPEHLSGWPRYHVEVHFRESVGGPVLAGIGRHYGIGVFAAPRAQ